jgi:subtilisin family serine protease
MVQRLFWVLVLLVSIFTAAGPASAGQRVLLTAEGQSSAAGSAGAAALSTSGTVQSLRVLARMKGTVRVIVGLRVPFAPAAGLTAAEARQQGRDIAAAAAGFQSRFATAIARAPGSFRSFDSIPFAAIQVSPGELDRLATDPDVVSISPDLELRPTLLQSVPFIRANEAWAAGFTGLAQTVAVLDTGIDSFHPALAGRIVSEACYSSLGGCGDGAFSSTAPFSGLPCRSPNCSHGTHVAGIVAANAGPHRLQGVAPDASLISIRVFSDTLAGEVSYLSDLLKGLERVYVLRNTYTIAAVNMSLGSDARYSSTCDRLSPATTALIRQLRASGIVSVISSGNNGDAGRLSFPACISDAVSVGSVSDRNWGDCSFTGIPVSTTAADKVACYSNASRNLTLLAPGSPITSTVPGNQVATDNGTSMAAPHVTGAFALMRQKQPGVSADEMVEALRSTGKPVADYRNGNVVTPRIDAKAAIDVIEGDDGRLPIRLIFAGNGRGVVSFTPAGSKASCTGSCSSRYDAGTLVTLSAAPAAKTSFAGWAGACSGAGTCTITVSAATAVTALFYAISDGPPQELSYLKLGSGPGSVSLSADGQTLACDANCVRSYGLGTIVTLTAAPGYGTVLSSWSGVCKGRKLTCVVRMSAAKTVGATFTTLPVFTMAYSKAGSGDGAIDMSVDDSVTTCNSSCANAYPAGSAIRLTAHPAAGRTFSGWSGACRGRKTTCTLKLRSAASVTATFN